ncbi:MAG: anthranilate phosphoribosyltransferase [Phycisphaerae bacterium]|nr:anthranilate phosphoribosyltransferase [Phycisphaerae bacterium]
MSDEPELQPILRSLVAGEVLSDDQAEAAFEAVMTGKAGEAQIASLLTALAVRPGGPSTSEIVGAARAMRRHARKVPVPPDIQVIDTCGTGGDASGTFNVSTTAALIAAGAGAHVAKHGNRSVTSRSGSSQVLEQLGVTLAADEATLVRCLVEAGLCFCFAPSHHPAMKYAVPVRQQLGFRTIFNVLGPLTNPAGARRQVVGVWSAELTEPIARVIGELGAEHAMVVHGDGLDEMTTTGPTQVSVVGRGDVVETLTIDPADLGLERASLDQLRVGSVEESAAVVRQVLAGEPGPARDIAALNAAAALVVADRAADLQYGLSQAFESIDSGAAAAALQKLVELTGQ